MKELLQYRYIIPLALFLGFAPFFPEPHVVEKIGMLVSGTLKRPIDIFDLFWHSCPLALLVFKLLYDMKNKLLN